MSVGVFPLMLQLMLCKGKVRKLFESLECLRIRAAKSDVRRLIHRVCKLKYGPPKNDSRKQYFYFLEFDIQAFPTQE